MTEFPLQDKEIRRLAALYQLEILDTDPEEDYDNIASLAAQICNMPVSMIGFIDHSRTWYKSCKGFDLKETLRHESFWTNKLGEPAPIVITDTLLDKHAAGHDLVTKSPYLRSTAIVPLLTEDGYTVGHLSVADTEPRVLSREQLTALRMLAKQISSLLKLRLQIIRLHEIDEQSKKQKEFYENILNKIPTDIAVFGPDHKYLFVNPGAIKDEELRKYIVGKDDFEYARYRNRSEEVAVKRRERFLEAITKGEEIRWEDSLRNPEGKVITHLRRLFPVYDEHKQLSLVIGFGLDITDRKDMEEKQNVLVKQLSAQNVQLLDFCNIVSHNLRGPLINMSMLVDFIKDSKDQDEQKLLVSKLNPVIDNLNSTFNDLVESIQIRQDIEIQSEHIDLSECLQKVLDSLGMEIRKTNAIFSIDFSAAPVVNFPPKYLLSIFHNLITNPLKYYSPERPLTIEVISKRRGTSILLSIKDNGLGIDLLKHHEHVFKIGKVFHRHPNAKGLGLYMTKVQVEAMGGIISVDSAPEKGSTFTIEFKNQY